ncbi:MAG TPA: DUF2127 domain-containing protein, partial [Frankiaceae bacterium]|nr:DUF2127 domain-containing protein [Frankiaceae bacterium]
MEWNLRTCARKGHVTYRPQEEDLAARLTAATAAGVAWRCLRCGDFVLGEPVASGPADRAPLVLRGRALRDATVLRVLAVERMLRAFLLMLIGYAVLRFRSSEARVQAVFDRALPAAKPLANVLHLDLDSSPTITKLRHLVHTKPGTLLVVAVLLFGYAAIQVVEGVGLWRMERWG